MLVYFTCFAFQTSSSWNEITILIIAMCTGNIFTKIVTARSASIWVLISNNLPNIAYIARKSYKVWKSISPDFTGLIFDLYFRFCLLLQIMRI